MGGQSHERLEPLVKPAQRTVSYDNGRTWQMSEERRLTPAEVWSNVTDEEGWESGHSYSGNFAVKPGFITFGTAAVDRDVLLAAGELVQHYEYPDDGDPLVARKTVYCGYREPGVWCSNGKVTRTVEVDLPGGIKAKAQVQTDCPQCNGTGKRPRNAEEMAQEDERVRLAVEAAEAFGVDRLKAAAQQYGDKWGEAVALVGSDHVWFGGVCSS